MRTLRKFNTLAFVVVLVLVSGCATNRTTKMAGTNTEQTRIDSAPNTIVEGFIGPEICVKPPPTSDTRWWEYALMPVTIGSGMLLW